MPHPVRRHIAQQIVDSIKNICDHDINFIDTDGIIYAILPDGAAVTGGVPSEGVLDIRSEVNGVTVKCISDYSFAGTMKGDGTVERRSDIERAVLPNLKSIFREAV